MLRKCACGTHTIAGDTCPSCRTSQPAALQAKLRLTESGDAFEQEADRLAAAVVAAGNVRGGEPVRASGLHRSPSTGHRRAPVAVQRQEPPKEKSTGEKLEEGAKKVGEAFVKTPLGKDLKSRATALGERFVSTLPGKIITGAAAAGAVSAIVATNSELPIGIPDIPLDSVYPGLKMNITYEGPVRNPTKVAITFSDTFGAPKPAPGAKPPPTEKERFRAETARMAEGQQQFREMLKSPQQRAAEDEQFWDAYWQMQSQDPLNPLRLLRRPEQTATTEPPATAPKRAAPKEQAPPPPPDVKLPPKPKREDEALQRRARAETERRQMLRDGDAPAIVYDVLSSGGGQSLDAGTRDFMEARFGYDFGDVRVHTGPRAEDSARAVSALAYTVGRDMVFDSGQYAPHTPAGRLLLAHELVHTIQQGAVRPLVTGESAGRWATPERLEPSATPVSPLAHVAAAHSGAPLPPAGHSPAAKGPRPAAFLPGPIPVLPSGLRLARAKEGNPDEEQKKKQEKKRLEDIQFEEMPDSALPPDKKGQARRFCFLFPFPIPAEKGEGPKSRPVETVWKERAQAGALEAVMSADETPVAVLKQKRDSTNKLRSAWLVKVRWPQHEAHQRWKETGVDVGVKATGFKRYSGGGRSARFKSTKVNRKTSEFDHIVELQFGGTNIPENIQVLDSSDNQSSGSQIKNELSRYTNAVKESLIPSKDLKEIILHFDDAVQKEPIKPPGPTALMEQAAAEAAEKVKKEAARSETGEEVYPYPIKAGGTTSQVLLTAEQDLDPSKKVQLRGSKLVENATAAMIIPGMLLHELERARVPTGKGKQKPDKITAYLETQNSSVKSKSKTRLPITIAESDKTKVTLTVDRDTRKLKLGRQRGAIPFIYPYLSKGAITKLEYTPEEGLSGEGWLKPSLPMLRRMRFGVAFSPEEFRISAGLDPKKLRLPIPGVKITQAELSLGLMPEFDPKGLLAFDYKPGRTKLLDGSLEIGKDEFGLATNGKINVYIPGVDAAEGHVKYSNGEWMGGARIAASQLQRKLKYVQSGEVVVGFSNKGIDADGMVVLANIPYTDNVEARIKKQGAKWVFAGKGRFRLPRLKPVTLWFSYDGDHLYASGNTHFDLFGLDGDIKVDYRDGKYWGEGSIHFEKGRAKGDLEVALSRKGKFSGSGSLTYMVTNDLTAKAGIRLDENEKMTLVGSLVLTKPIPLFDPIEGSATIFTVGIRVPIPGASVAGVGLKVGIDGSLKARYKIGPGVLRNVIIEAMGNPLEDNPDLSLAMGASFYVDAGAFISGSISGSIILDIGIAEAAGGLTLTATAALAGYMDVPVKMTYRQARFTVQADFEAAMALLIVLALTAWVRAEAGVWRWKVTTRKDWKLAEKTFDPGISFELRLRKPLYYASDTGFKFPSLSDVEMNEPKLDTKKMLTQSFSSASSREEEL
jgi:hypothetical protein